LRTRTTPYRVLLVDKDGRLPSLARPLFEGDELVPCPSDSDFTSVLESVRRFQPDIVVVDLTAPAAFHAIESVMAEKPTPTLALRPASEKDTDPFRALNLGALDVAEREDTPTREFWRDLARKLTLLAQVRVVQHVQGKRRKAHAQKVESPNEAPFPLVAIAASLGGPKALSVLLRMLPKTFPAPICIAQHISDGFTEGLAQWLRTETSLTAVEAKDGEMMVPGTVYIAPTGRHLLVERSGKLRLDNGPPLMGFKPSCNVLLASAAESFGKRAIGVILTGMGKDGAKGLADIRVAGGRTVAQDEASCVVYGMPREAVELGAAEVVLPLEEIAATLLKWVETC
jgi:two-component system chemotaxis response regulator CheB